MSLVEILVSLFIVSMSVLALVGLVSTSSRLGKSAESRAVAAVLATDLADRLRANPGGAGAGDYDWTPGGYPVHVPAPSPPGRTESDCTQSRPCSPAELAALDLYRWKQRLYHALPGGYGYVRVHAAAAATPPTADIWVAWSDATSIAYGERLAARECPPAFGTPGATGTPRCLYLEVAL